MKMLFIGTTAGGVSLLASEYAKAMNIPDIEILNAGLDAGSIDPDVSKILAEAKIDVRNIRLLSFDKVDSREVDVVIAFNQDAVRIAGSMSGHPEVINWAIGDDAGKGLSSTEWRNVAAKVKGLVDDFFERGYKDAFIESRRCENVILDNIHDGIIAHDLNRKIFFFNSAAEAITGYSRKDVLGRDCHDVFPGNFCGGKCSFCDPMPVSNMAPCRYDMDIVNKSGERKYVNMSVRPMVDSSGKLNGVLASFSDMTQEKRLARRVKEIEKFSGIIGRDSKMLEVFDLIKDLADVNVPVLIHGESGTGKELVAAAIHNEGIRANKLFVPVNCGALPEALLESELFGHVKGAFTGAIRDKKGRFELADGGTIFLDEIGDISPAMQVKLLRVLQEGTFERVGSEKTVKVDVRLISASNKDLSREIAEGRFREDLFYRLSVVPVRLPPLREKKNDIPLLVEHFVRQIRQEMNRPDVKVSDDAMNYLLDYEWPGNIRELQNWLQFAFIKCRSNVIKVEHFPIVNQKYHGNTSTSQSGESSKRRHKLDVESVRRAFKYTNGNRVEAAARLGVSRATLYRFLNDNPSALS